MADSHWKLGRRGQRSQAESKDAAAAAHEAIAVGEILRRNREQRGLELRQVAEMLHIRFPYLQAIENSLIDELPGPTYALGFVKAYAEHLGLDSETVVERFKAEQRGLNSKTELVFPSPLPEGKVPSAAILVVAAVMAVAAYSGWMYFSDVDERVAEVVPPLPAKVKEITKQSLTADSVAKAEFGERNVEATSATSVAVENTPPAIVVPNASDAADDKNRTKALTSENPNGGKATKASGEVAGAVKAVAPLTNPGSAVLASKTTVNPVVPTAPVTSQVMPAVAAAQTPAAPENNNPITVTPREPKVYGAGAGNSRIVMLAVGATWVEIRDAEKDVVLLTRVLYEGDRYRAPNRAGLVLMTGNAGGIQITVDGQKVPSIGPKGSVRRNVQLDPVALRQGKAVLDLIGLQQQQSDATPKTNETAP